MKKIYSLIFLLAVLCSCSSDDTAPIANDPNPTWQDPAQQFLDSLNSQLSGTPGFLKSIQKYNYNLSATYSNSFTRYHSYEGDKLAKILEVSWSGAYGYSLGATSVYTYTGDLITQIERSGSDNAILSTIKYFYDNQQRLIRYEISYQETFKVTEFTHNEDNSVTAVFKEANGAGELEVISTQIQYYNELGEMIKIINGNTETRITYDTSSNPYKLIKGFDKLSIYGKEYSHLHNVTNIRTITHIEGTPDQISDSPETWTYNGDSFPLTHTIVNVLDVNGQPYRTTHGYY